MKTGRIAPRNALETLQQTVRDQQRQESVASRPEMPKGLIIGDFRQVAPQVPDGCLSLIFTDPPYAKRAALLYADLGEFAAKKLAPGGSLISSVGHLQLPEAMIGLGRDLWFWCPIACVHSGSKALMREYGVRVG